MCLLQFSVQAAKTRLENTIGTSVYSIGQEFEIIFDHPDEGYSESIQLDIPEAGLKQGGWSITPMSPLSVRCSFSKRPEFIQSTYLQISRTQVDSYKAGRLLPYCVLQVNLSAHDKVKKNVGVPNCFTIANT